MLLCQSTVVSVIRSCASKSSPVSLVLSSIRNQTPSITIFVRKMSSEKPLMFQTLDQCDPELFEIIKKEKDRQLRGLEMIASENITSVAVLQSLSTCLHNKYAEGYPGQRYLSFSIFSFFIVFFYFLNEIDITVVMNILMKLNCWHKSVLWMHLD